MSNYEKIPPLQHKKKKSGLSTLLLLVVGLAAIAGTIYVAKDIVLGALEGTTSQDPRMLPYEPLPPQINTGAGLAVLSDTGEDLTGMPESPLSQEDLLLLAMQNNATTPILENTDNATMNTNATQATTAEDIIAQAQESGPVILDFFRNMAQDMVSSYWPKGTHPYAKNKGTLSLGIRALNLKYGNMRYYQIQGGSGSALRAALLNTFILHGGLERIYNAHQRYFMALLEKNVQTRELEYGTTKRKLTPAEQREFYTLSASFIRASSAALSSYINAETAPQLTEEYLSARAINQEKHASYAEAKAIFEEAKLDGAASNISSLQRTMTEAEKNYHTSLQAKDTAEKNLLHSLRRAGTTSGVSDDSLLYIAAWAHRRDAEQSTSLHIITQFADKLAASMQEAARN